MKKRVDYKPASKAIRGLAGKGRSIYNDRLKDGRRSYKILGWTKRQYNAAAKKLEALGYEVSVHNAGKVAMWALWGMRMKEGDIQYRLHVR